VENDSIKYVTSDPGFVGFDTITYSISCNGNTSFAKVFVSVMPYPDNITNANCTVTPEPVEWGIAATYSNEHNLSAYQSVMVGDIDGDGVVELVAAINGTPDKSSGLAIYKGNDIQAAPKIIININNIHLSLHHRK
jgi:hypothetical protein